VLGLDGVRVTRLLNVAIVMFVAASLAAVVPVTKRLAAPLVCPSGYARSIVVIDVSSGEDDTAWSSALWCAYADRATPPVEANGRTVLAILVAEFLVVVFGTRALAGVWLRVAGRAPRAGDP
jgi:hypothetical protein